MFKIKIPKIDLMNIAGKSLVLTTLISGILTAYDAKSRMPGEAIPFPKVWEYPLICATFFYVLYLITPKKWWWR